MSVTGGSRVEKSVERTVLACRLASGWLNMSRLRLVIMLNGLVGTGGANVRKT